MSFSEIEQYLVNSSIDIEDEKGEKRVKDPLNVVLAALSQSNKDDNYDQETSNGCND